MSEASIQIYDGPVRSSRTGGWIGTKRGDVIDVREDGFYSFLSERMRKHFRIIKAPWLEQAWWDTLLEPDMKGEVLIQKRKRFLDIDSQKGQWIRDMLSVSHVVTIGVERKKDFFDLVTVRPAPGLIDVVYQAENHVHG